MRTVNKFSFCILADPKDGPEKKIVFNLIRSQMEKRNEEMEALVVKDKVKASQLAAELQVLEAKTPPKRPRYVARKKHRCTLCNKSFATPSMLMRHQSVHTGKKPHWCQTCGKSYTQPEHLQRHIRAVHEEIVQGPLSVRQKPIWHVCSVCNQKFTAKYRYVEHLKVHINGLFECHLCDRKFTMKNSLVRHIRTHTGEKNWECDVCHKRFADQQTMKCHKRLHTGDYRYRCSVCERGFSKKRRLTEHLQKHAEEDGTLPEFCCNICYDRFETQEAADAHRKLHTVPFIEELKHAKQKTSSSQTPIAADESGGLLFYCSTCLQSFRSQSELTSHCQLYHKCIVSDSKGYTRFSCDICKQFFLTREEIQTHMKKHNANGGFLQTESVSGDSPEPDSSQAVQRSESSREAESATATSTTTLITTTLLNPHQVVSQPFEPAHATQLNSSQCQIVQELTSPLSSNIDHGTAQHLLTASSDQTLPRTLPRRQGLLVPPKKKILAAEGTQGSLYNRSLLTGLLEPAPKQPVTETHVFTDAQNVYTIEDGQIFGVADNGTMYHVVTTGNAADNTAATWPPTEQQMESGDLLLDIVPQDGTSLSFLGIPQNAMPGDGRSVQYVITDSADVSQSTQDVTCKLIQAAQQIEEQENAKTRLK